MRWLHKPLSTRAVVLYNTVFVLSMSLPAYSQSWSLTGNAGTNPVNNFLGTTDEQNLVIQARGGNVGIGTLYPAWRLQVEGGSTYGEAIKLANTSSGGSLSLYAYGSTGGGTHGGGLDSANTNSLFSTNPLFLVAHGNNPLYLYTNDAPRISVMGSGNVGIGTASPGAELEVRGGGDPLLLIDHIGGSGNPALWFQQDGAAKAFMWWDQANGRLNLGAPAANPIVSFQNDGTTIVRVLQITGGADLSEHFDVGEAEGIGTGESLIYPGLVVSIDPENPGHLVVSSQAYDHKVAGVISGAGGIKPGMLMSRSGSATGGEHPVALTGRVCCWADASFGPIRPGDLLTTSDTPGHAMKATDNTKAQGAILGKAMTELKQGRGLVLVLVTLQ
jgi:hypothetical protein